MERRPLKRRRNPSINDSDLPSRKCVRSMLNELQRTAEEVRCSLNSSNWLSVEERVRAALIIDHVEMMSRMMKESYQFGDADMEEEEDEEEDDEDYEYGDGHGHGHGDDAGDFTEEVAVGEPELPVIKGMSVFVEEKNENEGSGREEGGDEDEDGYGDGEKEDEDPWSPWIKRGVSFSAGAICTACTESEGS